MSDKGFPLGYDWGHAWWEDLQLDEVEGERIMPRGDELSCPICDTPYTDRKAMDCPEIHKDIGESMIPLVIRTDNNISEAVALKIKEVLGLPEDAKELDVLEEIILLRGRPRHDSFLNTLTPRPVLRKDYNADQ